MRQPQPAQRGIARGGRADLAFLGLDQPVAGHQQRGRAVGRAVVGDHDLRRALRLPQQRGERHGQHACLVVRGDDHAHARQFRTIRRPTRRQRAVDQRPRLHCDEREQQRVVQHISDPRRPCERAMQKERAREQQQPQSGHAAVDHGALPGALARVDARRRGGERFA